MTSPAVRYFLRLPRLALWFVVGGLGAVLMVMAGLLATLARTAASAADWIAKEPYDGRTAAAKT